ncbi:norbelladine synthase [Cannabis sativa]|uniref:Bet v I/Major latex protein domain-containing protein n=1 Tax=Cannabis sativa TaxID=3483 RepID=A0A803NS70_CANSA|nr:norbelladine synthase [Cannabis sativa]
MVSGQLSHELEIKAPASQVWELYGTLRLVKLIEEQLKSVIEKIQVVEGDGGVGTILHLDFVPGAAKFKSFKEKFTKIDNEQRVKEVEVVEGGFLELGFTLYRVRLEIIEKDEGCSLIKSTIEYEVKDDYAENVCLVSLDILSAVGLMAQNHLNT